MPTISAFFGIAIRMYHDDHAAPHFHLYYGEHQAKIEIETLRIMAGSAPKRVVAMVLEWAFEHRAELVEDWRLAMAHKPLKPIAPLE